MHGKFKIIEQILVQKGLACLNFDRIPRIKVKFAKLKQYPPNLLVSKHHVSFKALQKISTSVSIILEFVESVF